MNTEHRNTWMTYYICLNEQYKSSSQHGIPQCSVLNLNLLFYSDKLSVISDMIFNSPFTHLNGHPNIETFKENWSKM